MRLGLKILGGVGLLTGACVVSYGIYEKVTKKKLINNNYCSSESDCRGSNDSSVSTKSDTQPQITRNGNQIYVGLSGDPLIPGGTTNVFPSSQSNQGNPMFQNQTTYKQTKTQRFNSKFSSFQTICRGIVDTITCVGKVLQCVFSISDFVRGASNNIQTPQFNNNNRYSRNNSCYGSEMLFNENRRRAGTFQCDNNGVVHTNPSNPYALVKEDDVLYVCEPKMTIQGYSD